MISTSAPRSRHGWKLSTLALFLCLPPFARGQETTLTFTVPLERTAAGGLASVWLNALNCSSNPVSWTFPQSIKSRIAAAPEATGGSLVLRSPDDASLVILPGAFIRREYVLRVPESANGQVIVEFPGLKANRVVLDVEPPLATGSKTNAIKDSVLKTYITDAEPAMPDASIHPGQFFKEHISGYEPMYFVGGANSPNVKFQISFKYQLLNTYGPLAQSVPALKGFHIAYTQTSLWNLNGGDPAFYDTSYKPEFLYLWSRAAGGGPTDWFRLDLQGGLQHESNGKGGTGERSQNNAYFQPAMTFGREDCFQLALQPRVWGYLGNLNHNPDLADYRGYADLRTVIGWQRGLQLSALGHMGRDGDHDSVQLDLTYPTMRFFGSFSFYLDVQYFTGYGETLLGYNRRSDSLRVGFALFR